MTSPIAPEPQPQIRFERSYEASVEDLWALWTTKEGFESWWGPEGFRVEVHKMEARVGGGLVYDMIATDPEHIAFMEKEGMPISHGTGGTFTRVIPLKSLEITHMIDFIPGVRAYENRMVAEFFQEGKTARMVITVEPHPDPEWSQRAALGMESQLNKVPAALRARG